MHITEDLLAAMSLEAIYDERARQETIIEEAQNAIDLCSHAIVDKTARFKVGDLVVDSDGATWTVTRRDLYGRNHFERLAGDCITYRGRQIKKDGTVGAIETDIYRLPLRAAMSGDGSDGK